jgi:hypothetical protein
MDRLAAPVNRRTFLKSSALGFAGISAGVLNLSGCSDVHDQGAQPERRGARGTAGFRWSVGGHAYSPAYAYFKAARGLILDTVSIDAALSASLPAAAGSSAQALCRAWVARGNGSGVETGGMPPAAAATSDFGPLALFNPAKLGFAFDPAPLQDVFYSCPLRAWTPAGGQFSVAETHNSTIPALHVDAGDHVIFSILLGGSTNHVDLRSVLEYS